MLWAATGSGGKERSVVIQPGVKLQQKPNLFVGLQYVAPQFMWMRLAIVDG